MLMSLPKTHMCKCESKSAASGGLPLMHLTLLGREIEEPDILEPNITPDVSD